MNRLLTIVDSKYQRLEYLESSGTQYIDTDYIAKTNTVFEVDCAFTDLSAGRNGSLWASGINTCRYYFGVSSSKFIGANNTTYNYSIQDADTQRHTFAIKQDGIYIDNTNVYSSNAVYGVSAKIYLFAINDTGVTGGVNYYCKQKMYGSKIWDNGTLVRNYIPVRRLTDNVLGMYDTVSKTFFTNAGTGKFTANLDTMYAIIQGSPTQSPYGVFSGFSASNYLQLQNDIDTSKDWEFVVKFDNTTSKYHSVILGSNSTANSIKIEVSYGTRFFIFLSSNGTSWNIANGAYGLTNAMSLGNTYYMKLTYSTTSGYKLYLSTDGKEWVSQYTNGATNPLYMTNAKFILGASLFDNNSLGGGIDLNRSYVKSQSTKYNLQAVVGYTVVGSPTITDGVVSGFIGYPNSPLSYLKITNDFDFDKDFKIFIDVETSDSGFTGTQTMLSRSVRTKGGLLISFAYTSRMTFACISSTNTSLFNKTYTVAKTLKTFTKYNIYVERKANNIHLIVKDDVNDEILNVTEEITDTIGLNGFSFGGNLSDTLYTPFYGSIDMNTTNIKTENKLWFNGQQA